jgi:lipopolysaccharide transport system ATP-binding protein
MPEYAIVAENLSKRYFIGHKSTGGSQFRYTALRDVFGREIRNFTRNALDLISGRQVVQGDEVEEFWALRNVDFEVRQGEVLGIVGRNGAGKSTLLKILSRITEPTEGRIILRGRVSSLLEVGTGFHPELTGRENIFLNGAVLGMSQREIRNKFDEIVAFAEVEKFLDTPVKHYSSGMYVRLAFAVAAHLEPEILIIDEVLAVGDIDFQKKCFGKMQEVARKDGRTILFVSHNLAAVESMCTSGILLVGGTCVARGSPMSVVQEYIRDIGRASRVPLSERADRRGSGDVKFLSVSLETTSGHRVAAFQCGGDAVIHLVFENKTVGDVRGLRVELLLRNEMGQAVALLDSMLLGVEIPDVSPGRESLRVVIPRMPLVPGRYHVTIFSTVNGTIVDWIRSAAWFDVEGGDYYGTGQLPPPNEAMFLLDHRFVVGEDSTKGKVHNSKKAVPDVSSEAERLVGSDPAL